MPKPDEISDEEWRRTKERGAEAAREYRMLSRGDASEMAAKLAGQRFVRPGDIEWRDAFYQGFMGHLGH